MRCSSERARAVGLFCFALVLAACDVPSAPAVDGPRVLRTHPAADAEGVSRRARVSVVFDRALLPRSIDASTVRLVSGDRSFALTRHFDPVSRTLTLEPSSSAVLQPELRYRIILDGLRDLEGRAGERLELAFRTGTDETPPAPLPRPGFAQVAPIFAARCASASCHGGDTPVLGLDLSSGAAIAATAIARPSVETGEAPLPGARLPGLAGMRRIEVAADLGFPEQSYLVFKIIGDPHVVGEPMPPGGDGGVAGLSYEEAQQISDWIRAGAPTE